MKIYETKCKDMPRKKALKKSLNYLIPYNGQNYEAKKY